MNPLLLFRAMCDRVLRLHNVARSAPLICAVLLTFGTGSVCAAESPAPERSATAAGNSAAREALLFGNGDRLYGTLESIRPETGIQWRHPDADGTIEFAPDNITEIHFPPRQRTSVTSASACRLQLSNQDELEGIVKVFDREKAVLETWYAGEITIPRQMIQAVIPIPPDGNVLFDGLAGVEGWTIGKVVSALGDAGEWRYANGAFYATNAASIARKLDVPDVARIEFDLAWKGLFQLAVAIYTDYMQPINLANKDKEPEFSGFYSLQLNSFSANLLPVKKNDPLRYLGQVSVPAFNQKNTAHVEIRASKPKRSVALYVDGQLLKQWVDTEEFAGQGRGMRFVHQGQGKVKLSHLRISEWDGQTEEAPVLNPEGKDDITRLRNADKVAGPVESIQDGNLTVLASGTSLVIPLSRVKHVEFAGDTVQRPPATTAQMRATFNRGGVVQFRLEEWDAGKVVGTSPYFGRLAFDAAAFSKVEFK